MPQLPGARCASIHGEFTRLGEPWEYYLRDESVLTQAVSGVFERWLEETHGLGVGKEYGGGFIGNEQEDAGWVWAPSRRWLTDRTGALLPDVVPATC